MKLARWQPQALSVLRILAGLLYGEHGTQKLLNWPGGHGAVPLASFMGFAGILEIVGGILILIGLFTRPTAFILAGQMAVAYFMEHAPKSLFPAVNGGDDAILFCFIFLYLIFAGQGAWSIDSLVFHPKTKTAT
jgi:putative oxidoreductase